MQLSVHCENNYFHPDLNETIFAFILSIRACALALLSWVGKKLVVILIIYHKIYLIQRDIAYSQYAKNLRSVLT